MRILQMQLQCGRSRKIFSLSCSPHEQKDQQDDGQYTCAYHGRFEGGLEDPKAFLEMVL